MGQKGLMSLRILSGDNTCWDITNFLAWNDFEAWKISRLQYRRTKDLRSQISAALIKSDED
jgi:hypothetical protein